MASNFDQRSFKPKVIDFGTNRKRVYVSLLVVNIATWTLSCTVSEIRRLKCRKSTNLPTPLLFRLKFGGVPFGEDPSFWGLLRAKRLGLSAVQLFSQITILQRYRRTDRRTDGETTCLGNTALRIASRGKNKISLFVVAYARGPAGYTVNTIP